MKKVQKELNLGFWNRTFNASILLMIGLIFVGSVVSAYWDSMVPMGIGTCVGFAIALFCLLKVRCPSCGRNLSRFLGKDGCYCPKCGKFIHPDDPLE